MEPERILLLAHVTASRMFVPQHLRDDAIGEAAEAGVRAAATFDAAKSPKVELRVIAAMRWAILDFVKHELSRPAVYLADDDIIDESTEGYARDNWADAVAALRALPALIHVVLIGCAQGYPQSQISKRTGLTGFEIAAYREIGIAQMHEMMII